MPHSHTAMSLDCNMNIPFNIDEEGRGCIARRPPICNLFAILHLTNPGCIGPQKMQWWPSMDSNIFFRFRLLRFTLKKVMSEHWPRWIIRICEEIYTWWLCLNCCKYQGRKIICSCQVKKYNIFARSKIQLFYYFFEQEQIVEKNNKNMRMQVQNERIVTKPDFKKKTENFNDICKFVFFPAASLACNSSVLLAVADELRISFWRCCHQTCWNIDAKSCLWLMRGIFLFTFQFNILGKWTVQNISHSTKESPMN